jgi:hypothetical protein
VHAWLWGRWLHVEPYGGAVGQPWVICDLIRVLEQEEVIIEAAIEGNGGERTIVVVPRELECASSEILLSCLWRPGLSRPVVRGVVAKVTVVGVACVLSSCLEFVGLAVHLSEERCKLVLTDFIECSALVSKFTTELRVLSCCLEEAIIRVACDSFWSELLVLLLGKN